jgi:flagellar basal body P-ring formation protein FlgA
MRRLLLAMLAPFAVGASSFQPIDDIARAAEAAVAPSPGQTVEAAVDPGLRLPACPSPLSGVMRSATSVEVACADLGWRIFVPLRVQRLAEVWVLRRPLAAGEAIGADAVVRELRDVARLPGGPLSVAQPLDGASARRALPAGAVLLAQDTQSPRLIRRGDAVVLLSRIGPVEVRAQGKALAAAGVDERINVENSSSRRVVQGVVLASGEVLVR